MGKGLQVRELPDHLYAALSEDARRTHRSMTQSAVTAMERGLAAAPDAAERRKAILAAVRA